MASILEMVKVAQEMKRLHRQALGPNVELLRSVDQLYSAGDAFKHVREQILLRETMMRKVESQLTALARPAFDASRSIAALLDATRIDRSIALFKSQMTAAEGLASVADVFKGNVAGDWARQLKLADAIKDVTCFPLQTHLAKLYEWSAVAESSLARVKSDFFGVRLGLESGDRTELAARHDEFANEYRTLFGSVESSDLGVLEVPSSLTELPAGEFVNQTALVVSTSETETDEDAAQAQREVTTELAAETSDHLTVLISELNPELPHLLNGAREAYASRHTDFVRHFVTSYRELFTHILHTLSPDEEVAKWTKDPAHYSNKRPTRKARLLFITRDLGSTFGGFVNANVEAVLTFIDAFQKGTHGINPKFTDEQLADLKNRTEGLLRFLLTIYHVTTFGVR